MLKWIISAIIFFFTTLLYAQVPVGAPQAFVSQVQQSGTRGPEQAAESEAVAPTPAAATTTTTPTAKVKTCHLP